MININEKLKYLSNMSNPVYTRFKKLKYVSNNCMKLRINEHTLNQV